MSRELACGTSGAGFTQEVCQQGAWVGGHPCRLFAKQITAGRSHTCALSELGDVYCWGYGEYGQLGSGTTLDNSISVLVQGLEDVVAVSAGSYHTCALHEGGEVYCWGNGDYSQLGNGSTLDSSVPVLVQGFENAVVVSAGGGHNCVLREGGEI